MLAPSELVATSPSTPIAAATRRVVVVLPLVPETSATRRPAARWRSSSGSILRPSQPPITEPSPRPAARDSAAAVLDTEEATLARRGRWPRSVSSAVVMGTPLAGRITATRLSPAGDVLRRCGSAPRRRPRSPCPTVMRSTYRTTRFVGNGLSEIFVIDFTRIDHYRFVAG